MSTRSTVWLGADDKGTDCHLDWKLAERTPGKAAPIFMKIEAEGRETTIKLPRELAQKIR